MKEKISITGLVAALAATSVLAVAPMVAPWGVYLNYLDAKTAPGNDFFVYTNGGWLKSAAIPPDRQAAGVNLDIDRDNELKLGAVVSELNSRPEAKLSGEERKLKDLYNAFLDEKSIEDKGIEPLKTALEKIAALTTPEEVASYMASPETLSDGPFEFDVTVDESNPKAYIVHLEQAGLGMPDRDYYLGDDPELIAARRAYHRYLNTMLTAAGIPDVRRAEAVFDLEMQIARWHWAAEERRDAIKTHNPMSISALEHFAPKFPWQQYFSAAGISRASPAGERVVVIAEKTAFPGLAEIFRATPIAVWRDFLTVRLLHGNADLLPNKISDADFAFYGVILNGQRQQLPRAVRAERLLDETMGQALGKLYCARYFPPAAKAKIQALVANLLQAYAADIKTLDWMSEPTRARALEKIASFYPKVGYPDQWRDYSALAIRRDDLIGSVHNASVFEIRRHLARLDLPVDRGEWEMTPATNNAYYNPTLNEIVFPAGGLQPPFFDPNADDAVNYGSIGATIGHEISHGFDDQGSKYDASGRLANWWTDEDRKKFDARTREVAQQYDQFEPLPGLHLNGRLTLGENIADLAGLVMALKAYRLSLGGKSAPVLDGFTGDQRLLLAYGQSWREVWNDELTRRLVISDPHSPSKFRVNGVVRNVDDWYGAFDVKPTDKLYLVPDKRARLW